MINIYETRTMLRAIEQMKRPRTFLLNTFFTAIEQSTSKHVDIDIVRGKRRLAVFVNPLHEGRRVDRKGYTTSTIEPPYIKQKMPIKPGHSESSPRRNGLSG